MDLDNISEEQARHILDILARKAGYHCVYISKYGRLLIEAGSTALPICIDDFGKDYIIVNRIAVDKQDLGCQGIYYYCLSRVLAGRHDSREVADST